MKDAIQLTKIEFDNLENRNGEIIEFTKVFIGDKDGFTAYHYLSEWFKKQPQEQRYMGWDFRVYPIYKIEHIKVNE